MTSEPTKAIKAVILGRPYAISFGGWTDFQYVDDVAKAFVAACERPYEGAGAYNLRGEVVTLETFLQTLCTVLPEAKSLVTIGTTQIAIAYDLSDYGITNDLGPMAKTSLAEGIRQTAERFKQLRDLGRLDDQDLAISTPASVIKIDEV
jgi:nucleoside-diphosphate-sugar epimerase